MIGNGVLHDIVFAKALGGHRIHLRFDDGVEGEVDLRRVIPEFKGMNVAVLQGPAPAPGGGAAAPPKFYTVPAARDITLKDPLTHTSGLSSGPMGQSEVRKNRRKPTETLADYIPRLGSTPLEFQRPPLFAAPSPENAVATCFAFSTAIRFFAIGTMAAIFAANWPPSVLGAFFPHS